MPFYSLLTIPLKFRLIATTLASLAVALLAWVYFSVQLLNNDISVLINNSQQESMQQLAGHIDDSLHARLNSLDAIAAKLAVPISKGAEQTKNYLNEIPLLQTWFTGGMVAYNLRGMVVAQVSPADVQANTNANHIDYVVAVLQNGKSAFGPLEINFSTQNPEFGMAVPVRDEQGQIVGALQGLTVLNQTNFLSRFLVAPSGLEEGYVLVDPVRRLVVASANMAKVNQAIPHRGENPVLDNMLFSAYLKPFLDKLENSSTPTPILSSAISSTGWVLLSEQSSNWAVANLMQKQKLKWLAFALLIGVALLLICCVFKSKLLPIHKASEQLANQIKSKKRWIHQPIAQHPQEMSEIIGGVNQLLNMLGQGDAKLPQVDYFAKSLAENMPDVVGYWTTDLRCTFANQGYLHWFGFTSEQMLGIHIKTVLGDKLYAQNAKYIQAVLKGENQQFERQIVQVNGKKRDAWVQYMAHKVHDEVLGFFVFMVDITQVKTRESVARISDAALQSISQGIIITDAKHRILLLNSAFTSITGYEKKDVVNRNWRLLEGKLTNPIAIASMNQAMRERVSFSGEFVHYRKDGSTFWNEMTLSPVHDDYGQVTHYTGAVRDITQRKTMEDERLQVKMQLERDNLNRSILNSLPVDLAVINREGKVLALNHPQQTLGTMNDVQVHDPFFPEAEGLHFLELNKQAPLVTNAYRKQVEKGVCAVLDGTAQRFSVEYPMDDSADPHWSSLTVTPMGLDQQGAIVARQDITQLKRASLDLQAAMVVAEKANHAKSHFLATASHDLRQPLSALALYVAVLGKRAEPQQQELVNNIKGCVDSLSDLLKDLLDVSKLDAGVVTSNVQDFAVDDVLASYLAIHSVNASIKGLKLRMRPSGAVVHTDPKLLGRMVGNLVTNAIRYTHHGGVLLACRKHGNSWWLEVWDTGEGIPADKHALIFEEFQQLNQSGRSRGSGLGLAIVKKMATLLGLTIHLRSRPGRGSVFAIELPVADHPISKIQDRVSQNNIPRPLRMAVVDDDSRVLSAMVMALQGVGHEVVAASDADALVQQLANHAPDIVISDYRLEHGRTGFEVIEAVRQQFGKEELPAIIVTGDTDPQLIRSMADQGIAVHYKPLQLETLQAFVKESVERRLL